MRSDVLASGLVPSEAFDVVCLAAGLWAAEGSCSRDRENGNVSVSAQVAAASSAAAVRALPDNLPLRRSCGCYEAEGEGTNRSAAGWKEDEGEEHVDDGGDLAGADFALEVRALSTAISEVLRSIEGVGGLHECDDEREGETERTERLEVLVKKLRRHSIPIYERR